MPAIVSNTIRLTADHFEPAAALDPAEQRKLHGRLEQIDYTAYTANTEIVGRTLKEVDLALFKRLAESAAQARVRWVATALALSERPGAPLSPAQVEQLTAARRAFEELSDAYDGLRRLVERGYLPVREG